MIRRPPRSTQSRSSAASDVYKRQVNAPLKPGKNNLEFRDSGYTFSNLIHNGSFEQGLWNREVQDFHNYDKRPVLAMRITEGEKGKGSKAVELEAARHIAATTQNGIPVNPGSSYLISIDYQSPNGGNGEYEVLSLIHISEPTRL